ncbi:hypothetical protein DFH08DRAFT_820322 [Mycena albidolilacea]|uniref:Uncharacterized protein n=1 Tax=Mycena albidolilacea TaxID=1033008 RepID=A0AAD6ZCH8_9AGAR|nr:hypothetical protein DFH08DRAFT_820322 [Mycena albidolilacea]
MGVSPKQYEALENTANCKPSNPVVAGIPMPQDLLNVDSQHEDALFNHPDPYGMEDLEVMEEGAKTQWFAANQGMPEEPMARPAKLPAQQSTGSWTTKDAEWDAGNW